MTRDEQDKAAGWGELLRGPQAVLAGLLLLGVWLNAADALVTVTLMPSVAKSIGGYAYFAWAAGAFMLGGIVSCASGGHLASRVGLRAGLLLSGSVYAAGCVLSAAAPGVMLFLLGRLAQGVGAGWIVALVFVAIGVVFPERLSARLFAAISGVWGAATLLGPLVGGVFATLGIWRWVFWAFAAQALVFVAGVALALPKEARAEGVEPGAPWLQLGLVALGVLGVAFAGVVHGAAGIASGAVGLALLGAMLAVDRRAKVRILPRAGTDLGRWSGQGYAAIFLLSAGSIIHSIYSPVLLQRIHGASPLLAGYVVACEAVGWSTVAFFIGGAPVRWQGRLIRFGGLAVAAGLVALAFTLGHADLWVVALASALMGAGFGASFAFMSARIVAGIEGDERALASAAVPNVQSTGNAVGAAFAGVMAAALGLGRPFDAATASASALPLFAAFIPLAALGAFAAWRLGSDRGKIG
jgi:MFS family permease